MPAQGNSPPKIAKAAVNTCPREQRLSQRNAHTRHSPDKQESAYDVVATIRAHAKSISHASSLLARTSFP
jgi:hypothetical protein